MEMRSGKHILFQQGLARWKNKDYQTAEQYWRYAAYQGDFLSREALRKGISLEYFNNDEQRLNSFVVDILETLGYPAPSQEAIDDLEKVLRKCVKKWVPHFGEI